MGSEMCIRDSSNAMLLRFASEVPYGFRGRQRFGLVPKIASCKQMCKQSSQQSDQSCFGTDTRTTHTRKTKPYRLGAVWAGVVGERDRCCPAATVPVAVVLPCGVCCCNAQNKQIQSSTEKQRSAIIVHKPSAQQRVREQYTQGRTSLTDWRGAGRSSRGTRPLLSSSDGARSCRISLLCLLLYC